MQDFFASIGELFSTNFSFGDIGVFRIILTILLSFFLGMIIYYIYRRTFAGVLYSRNFGISLVMLCMITSTIIITITSNLTLSLGMVGALSIVRFRTAVKDPIDTVYMFWSISAGIMIGAKFFLPAFFTTLVVAMMLLVLSNLKLRSSAPYLMVIRYSENAQQSVGDLLNRLPKGRIKSKTVTANGVELTVEMRLRDSDLQVVDRFLSIPGVFDAAVIAYSGDIIA